MARPRKVNVSVVKTTKEEPKELTTQMIKDAVSQAKSVEVECQEIEYNGHTIHIESSGRVMVTDRGLHVNEFIAIGFADIDSIITKAKEYINERTI